MSANRQSVRTGTIRLLRALAVEEGYTLTRLADVRLLRSNRPLIRTPVLYEPGIVVVCQGRKRGYLGEELYLYDAQHYLVVSVPVPFSMETDATQAEPLLAIYFRLDFALAADLSVQLNEQLGVPKDRPLGMYSSPMEERLEQSVFRLLAALENPVETEILGAAILREIYFRIFTGAQGGSLRTALAQRGHFGKVGRAIRQIHDRFDEALTVEELAAEAAMSVPSFHAHFRAVTGTSPMRYVQSTRLHQARLLMFRGSATAAAASAAVGYESRSQFSREFKRLFGRPPMEEIARMKRNFALPAPMTPSKFVSSH